MVTEALTAKSCCREDLRVAKFSQDWYLYYFQSHYAHSLAIVFSRVFLFPVFFASSPEGTKCQVKVFKLLFQSCLRYSQVLRRFSFTKKINLNFLSPAFKALYNSTSNLPSNFIIDSFHKLISSLTQYITNTIFVDSLPQSLCVNQPGNIFSLPTYILSF